VSLPGRAIRVRRDGSFGKLDAEQATPPTTEDTAAKPSDDVTETERSADADSPLPAEPSATEAEPEKAQGPDQVTDEAEEGDED
jgi:hypothetical protein